ncbi:glucose repression mediator protein [Mortierella polycephala]|uniref:Glucose repression mediator protein n=1 Tax=Mortierella polycephala TaxID=41804 RepID=A0A9P6U5D5_9FUNG|nr:glucose repression mediator protein [Mortierella polycephala]
MSANGPPPAGPPPPHPQAPPPGHAPGSNSGPAPGPGPAPVPSGPGGPAPIITSPAQRLDAIDEQVWLQIGSLAESMGEYDRAMAAYESALRHNYHSIGAMNLIAELYRTRENFPKAAEYFQRILAIDSTSGEVWGSLGHCYLMMDELQKAYNAYQNALHHLPNPKDSKLWYGIGILYDRYGSVEHAEEAFSAVMRMDPKSDNANEIYFRLGIIYKGQQKYAQSLECFRYILHTPPRPLTEADIWFQIGHVHEQQKEYTSAKDAYERVLTENPNHAKVLQQLGWLYHQQNASFMNQDLAIKFLTRSIESDNTDAQSWYLMGRCYMAQQKFNKAYEAYQQAVYRDSRNPTFWCSIGLLYFQINQYRDALDAYSKAIRINPNISEVWYDLGTLYESCNNQVNDAIDAYQRASDLDPDNPHIKQRLEILRQNNGGGGSKPPLPEEMNAQGYQPQDGANGQHPFGQWLRKVRQQACRVTLVVNKERQYHWSNAANMNGEHPQPGRDLPIPGANHGEGHHSMHPSAGRYSDSPSAHLNDERQPHIPGINPGGPRPPTPAGAMPQMMSGDRGHGPPSQPPHASGNQGHGRPVRGRPLSPGTEASYARAHSPGMNHPNQGQGHDPHYPPQHAYGHGSGPMPAQPMAHDEARQVFERRDAAGLMKQDQSHFQHDRHRSADLQQRGGIEQEHEGAPPANYPQNPYSRTSPPRDDRRPPSGAPGGPPSHQQHAQHLRHSPDDRAISPSQHAVRSPMDERPQESARPAYQDPRMDRGAPSMPAKPSEAPYQYPPSGAQQQSQYHGPESNRVEQQTMGSQTPPMSRPGNDLEMEDTQSRRSSQPFHGQGYGNENAQARWPAPKADSPPVYRTEQQDQDEIAASLVSLSGKGSQGPASRPNDEDDAIMEDAKAASVSRSPRPPSQGIHHEPPSVQTTTQGSSVDHEPIGPEQPVSSHQGSQNVQSSDNDAVKPLGEAEMTVQPAQNSSRPSTPAPVSARSEAAPGPTISSPALEAPKEASFENATGASTNTSDHRQDADSLRFSDQDTQVSPSAPMSLQTTVQTDSIATATTGPTPDNQKSHMNPTAPLAAQAPPPAPTADEDTEMEEGEVREDEDM